jgi:pilus assembly protein CpaE
VADDMRNKPAPTQSSAGWESVDTIIRPSEGDHNAAPEPTETPPPPLRVLPKFGGNLNPQTLPTHILQLDADRVPMHTPQPAPRRASQVQPAQPAPRREIPDEDFAPRGKVIVVFGCRGGAGSTMLAVNVGAQLARTGKSVCVLDLDLQLGDVFVALDLDAQTSLSAVAREAGTLDAASLRRRLVRHDSGLYALSQTGRLDEIDPELPERMPALLKALRSHFDYVVVDGVRDFGDHALAAMDVADKIALVLTQDVQAVRRAARVVQLFRRLNYADRKIHVVLNRHSNKAVVDDGEVERVLGLPVTASVRNDYERMRKALDEGSLLHDTARGTGVARDVERVARSLLSDPQRREPEYDEEPQGFWARLFGRK